MGEESSSQSVSSVKQLANLPWALRGRCWVNTRGGKPIRYGVTNLGHQAAAGTWMTGRHLEADGREEEGLLFRAQTSQLPVPLFIQ